MVPALPPTTVVLRAFPFSGSIRAPHVGGQISRRAWTLVAALALVAAGLLHTAPVGAAHWSHVGSGSLAATTAASTAVPLPGGTQTGDLLLLGCQGRNNDMNWSAGGYTTLVGPVGPAGTRLEILYKWAVSGEPGSITVTNAKALNGWSCSITAIRGGVASGSPLDAPPATQLGTPSTMTAPSVTTVSSDTLLTRWFASADDNDHGGQSEGSLAFGGTAYQTTTGVDHASSMSFVADATPGSSGTAMMIETANASDPWVAVTVALKPGTGDPPPTGPSEATVEITPGAGIGGSTFDGDSFKISNTGANPITQVVIDLSKAFLPDLRFDPVGDAGDAAAMCLTPGTSGAVGFSAPSDPCTTPFSGGSATAGYTTLTLDFTDFGPGEQFNFSVDVDPTTIKGFSAAGNAGAISGLELAGATSTVTFSDGAKASQTFGDGSQGGSAAAVPTPVTAAVGLSVAGVTTTDAGFSNGADAAIVAATSQSAVVTGPAGTAVSLIVVDAVTEDEPSGGYNDLDAFERNKVVSVTYIDAIIGSGGSVSVPFTVSDTAGEATYLMVAATGTDGTSGAVGAPIYLELGTVEPPPTGPGEATIGITPGGALGASTFDVDSFQIDNSGSNDITKVVIDLSKAFFADVRFDPVGEAGDNLAMCLQPSGTSDAVGFSAPSDLCTTPFSGGSAAAGYTTLTLDFADFDPGEEFNFSVDVDPTTIKGFSSAGNAGAVSGLELAGTTTTVTFSDGTDNSQTFGDGSQGGSDAVVPSAVTQSIGLSVTGVTTTDGGFTNGADIATVTATAQSAAVTAPAGTTVSLIVVDAVLEDMPAGGYNDLDSGERNKAVSVDYLGGTVGASGTLLLPFAVSETIGEATYIMAAATGTGGMSGPVTAPIYLEFDDGVEPPPPGGALTHEGTGALTASIGTSAAVALPGGVQAGDLLMLSCQGKRNTMDWSAPGYTSIVGPIGPAGLRAEILYKWAGGSEPTTVTVANTTGVNGWSCSITVFGGGLGSGSPLDAPPASQMGTGLTMTAPSVTSVTNGALVTRWFASSDDNNHGSPSAGALAFGGGEYDTDLSTDHASSMSYFVQGAAGPTGSASMQQTVNGGDAFVGITLALKPGTSGPPPPADPGEAMFGITPSGGIGASTFDADSFQLANSGGSDITKVVVDLSNAFLPDLRFDPEGLAGDATAMCMTPGTSDAVGYAAFDFPDNCTQPFSGGSATAGYTTLTLDFSDFDPGEDFNFSVDVDPTTIKGFDSAGNAGAISGLELAGTTATITFADGTQSSQTFGNGSQGGSDAVVPSAVSQVVTLSIDGVTTTDGGFSNGADVATVDAASQSAVLGAPAGTAVSLIVVNAVIEDEPVGGYNDLDANERNKVVAVSYLPAVIGAGGSVAVPFSVGTVPGEATYLTAAVAGSGGMTGPVTSPIYLELDGGVEPPPAAPILYRVNAGGPQVAAIDAGPAWAADTDAAPSPLHNAGSNVAGFAVGSADSTVPSTTPTSVFETERWDPAEGEEMQWNFPVDAGTEVSVRLYLMNGFDGTSQPGQRVFDVSLEGAVVLNDLDLSASVGHQVATMRAFTVTSDGTIDLDFGHETENPLINAIEIVVAEPQPNVLGFSPGSINFGNAETGTTKGAVVTLTNLGDTGDPAITIDSVSAGTGDFGAVMPADASLAPGESTSVDVTFSPTTTGPKTGTLVIDHSGSNDPVSIPLSGDAHAPGAAPVGFGVSALAGESSTNPTSLQFGPDDRLYVGQQSGEIKVYTVVRNGEDDYDVTATESILDVKSIPNHDDDGSVNAGQTNRQLTGLLVTGTATNPVIYATSSDPRIGAGGGPDLDLDTNSGVLSRLTWTGSDWTHVQLVRGLPRSEENHSSNGLALSPDGATIYIAQGGHTNQGAASNNFAFLPEYALSAAILSVDLDTIGDTTYDLPTIGTVGTNEPFGGNDGANQAMLVNGGPVQVYSPGWRNPYDVVITEAGRMYTVDNGPNGGWGAVPINEGPGGTCTNATNEPGSTFSDNLHFVSAAGYYGGHPNPTRGNKSNTFGGVSPVEIAANPVECDYRIPGSEDGALDIFSSSTNGITEYTATNFGGQMQGDLLTASFGGQIWRIQLTADGTDTSAPKQAIFSGFGNTPLDVTALGDDGPFPGTVWAATYGSSNITVFEPDDFGGGGGGTCLGTNDSTLDEDGDGYDNADEIDNGTDPCSAASQPPDADMDDTSDLNDPDDDNDSLLDTSDLFAVDNENGTTTLLPLNLTWNNDAPEEGGLVGLGFTGLMTNDVADYATLFDPDNMTAGGAAGVTTVDLVPAGDAVGGENSQQYGFQVGINIGTETTPFTATTRILAPFAGLTPENFQSMGLFIGTGDQSNYVKLVTSANGGLGGIEFAEEVNDVFTNRPQPTVTMPGPDFVDLFLTIDPVANTVQPAYQVTTSGTTGPLTTLGGPEPIEPTWLDGVLAVGIISTSFGEGDPFPATWDFLIVASEAAAPATDVAYRVNSGGPVVAATTGPDWAADTLVTPSEYWVANGAQVFTTADGGSTGPVTTGPAGVPLAIFDDERFDFPTGDPGELMYSFPVAAGAVVDVNVYLAEIYGEIDVAGERVFDISVDGSVPAAFDNVDPFALGGGTSKGSVVTAQITSDGAVDIEFLHGVENPNPKAIEIVIDTPAPADLEASPAAVAFGSVANGDSATMTVNLSNPAGSDGPVEITALDVTGSGFSLDTAPTLPATLSPGEGVDVTVEFAPTAVGAASGTLDVTHDGATALSVALSGSGEETDPGPEPGTVLFRVNAGGPAIAAVDDGPDWAVDDATTPSALHNTGSNEGDWGEVGGVDGTVPATTPSAVFQHERFDFDGGNEMLWDFAVPAETEVELRLYFRNGYPGTASPGARVFDVIVDGATVLDDFDISAEVGHDIGTMRMVAVTSDGNIDLDFVHDVNENPLINAIEIVVAGDEPEDDVVYRVNAGGESIVLAAGPGWLGDLDGSRSPHAIEGGGNAFNTADTIAFDASVPAETPMAVFQTERWDPVDNTEMLWSFAVQSGATYEVRLYLAEIFITDAGGTPRVFDVEVEGVVAVDDLNLFETYGHDKGVMLSHEVTMTDGSLDIVFVHGSENPNVKAIEVIKLAQP